MVKKIKSWWGKWNGAVNTIIAALLIAAITATYNVVSTAQTKMNKGSEAYNIAHKLSATVDSVIRVQGVIGQEVRLLQKDIEQIKEGQVEMNKKLDKILDLHLK